MPIRVVLGQAIISFKASRYILLLWEPFSPISERVSEEEEVIFIYVIEIFYILLV